MDYNNKSECGGNLLSDVFYLPQTTGFKNHFYYSFFDEHFYIIIGYTPSIMKED